MVATWEQLPPASGSISRYWNHRCPGYWMVRAESTFRPG